jgi:PAS domain-containing protein
LDNYFTKIKDVVTWPEFRAAWVLLAIIAAIFVLDINVLSGTMALIEGALLVIVFILVATSIYRTSQNDRNTSIERNELKSILGSLSDALIVYTGDFTVTFFNPAAERLFKIDAKTVLGHTISPRDIEKNEWRTLVQTDLPIHKWNLE